MLIGGSISGAINELRKTINALGERFGNLNGLDASSARLDHKQQLLDKYYQHELKALYRRYLELETTTTQSSLDTPDTLGKDKQTIETNMRSDGYNRAEIWDLSERAKHLAEWDMETEAEEAAKDVQETVDEEGLQKNDVSVTPSKDSDDEIDTDNNENINSAKCKHSESLRDPKELVKTYMEKTYEEKLSWLSELSDEERQLLEENSTTIQPSETNLLQKIIVLLILILPFFILTFLSLT